MPAFLGILNGTDARKHSIGSTTASPVHSERKSRIQFSVPREDGFHPGTGRLPSFPMKQPYENMAEKFRTPRIPCLS
ncbi:hypothetical protein HMPREF3038_00228 [Akkermansia sp. KLE1797]|nr:hypothetical protein HMPREF3038_00228 [Akkermansia sp. KLE1797]KXU54937.1 hypothetical protein HMPREF3039_00902 [Akkermansia sp. KLE1798]KZA04433.1 hypothetical protein HMPREF1326_01860 [Akkermansia sp. KLE1605]